MADDEEFEGGYGENEDFAEEEQVEDVDLEQGDDDPNVQLLDVSCSFLL